MASNSYIFSGAHGTPDVTKIQTYGFKILEQKPGTSMFGRGVYFYQADTYGRNFAKKWGELRALESGLPPKIVRVLCVSFCYSKNRFFSLGS